MVAQEAKASGALVIEAEGIGKAYDGAPIVQKFSTRIMRGDRIGVIGANGAGKTTLINMLTGALAPDTGEVRIGTNVAMARMDQKRDALPPTTTLVDALTGGGSDYVTINGERRHVVGYMKDFLFGPEQARTPIEKLSGGERGRLMLARALSLTSNLIVLDEPTNDLDVETLDLLQELLGDYKGTILIVSHDRDFLDRVATSVIVSEGGGLWREYAGGYSDMVSQRGYGLSGPAPAPARSAEKAEARPKGEAAGEEEAVVQREARAGPPAAAHGRAARRDRRARGEARRRRFRRPRPVRVPGGDKPIRRASGGTGEGRRRVAGARNFARRHRRTGVAAESVLDVELVLGIKAGSACDLRRRRTAGQSLCLAFKS